MHLTPCLECGRHVRAADASCPFCGAAHAAPPPAPPTPARASRALLLAAGAALALSACDAPFVSVAHADPLDPVSMAPQYGAPPDWDPPPPPRPVTDAGVAPRADAGAPRRPTAPYGSRTP